MREKQDFLRTPEMKKFVITGMTKKGDVITVQTKYMLTKHEEGIKILDIPFVFDIRKLFGQFVVHGFEPRCSRH